jgi:CheY-like chemotaxis protein
VAKILVADDNSNIQKMVGLALKDHGIEVLAVGNGEAAVRKISDVHPDLVLADVFMPVRNGYEVCSYVKEDKALSHIPVILLVGAFDPLDEQEAQRVGADGVLKKPFVPPDPLISMVKSALVRAGVAHSGFTPAKPVAETAPEPAVAPPPRPSVSIPEPKPFEAESETESFVDDVAVTPAKLKIEPEHQPVAFGSLLETPAAAAQEVAEETTTAPVGLGMERDWRSSKQEEEEEGSGKGSWRRDGGEESFVDEGVAASDEFRSSHQEPWTPTREKGDLTEAPEPAEIVPARMLDRSETLPSSPFSGQAWAAAMETHSDHKTAVAEAEHPEVPAAELERMVRQVAEPSVAEEQLAETRAPESSVVAQPEKAPEPPPLVALESAPASAQSPAPASSWFSTPPPSPWEAEARKASQLASTWDALTPAPSGDVNTRGDVSFEPPMAPDEIEIVAGARLSSEVSAAAAETAREEASLAVQQVERHGSEVNTQADGTPSNQENGASVDMDAIVAKVFARLSPSVLEGVTRDILKPLVEAVVREELESKKS